jgi:hypothetical protein
MKSYRLDEMPALVGANRWPHFIDGPDGRINRRQG